MPRMPRCHWLALSALPIFATLQRRPSIIRIVERVPVLEAGPAVRKNWSRFTKTTRATTGRDASSARWTGTRSSRSPGHRAAHALSGTRTQSRSNRGSRANAAPSARGVPASGDTPGSAGAGRSAPIGTRRRTRRSCNARSSVQRSATGIARRRRRVATPARSCLRRIPSAIHSDSQGTPPSAATWLPPTPAGTV